MIFDLLRHHHYQKKDYQNYQHLGEYISFNFYLVRECNHLKTLQVKYA